MKKFSLIALIASSLIFVGCGKKTVEETVTTDGKTVTDTVTKTVTNKAGEVVAQTSKSVTKAVTDAADATKDAASSAVDATKDAANAAVEATKDAASSAVDATKNAATGAVAAATGAATATADAAATATEGSDGKALFAKCASCHGVDGKTKALGKSEVIAGQPAADLETKIGEYKAGTRNTAGMGALMKGQVASYSDADIKAVAEYISTLK